MNQSEWSSKIMEAKDTLQMLAATDGVDQDQFVIATYYVETPSPDIVKYAVGVAVQQTTGTWVKVHGESSDLKEQHGGKVTQIFKVPGSTPSYIIQIAYPISNLTADFETLLATVMGAQCLLRHLSFKTPVSTRSDEVQQRLPQYHDMGHESHNFHFVRQCLCGGYE